MASSPRRMLLEVLAVSQKPLSELRRSSTVFPQKLENIRVKQKTPVRAGSGAGGSGARQRARAGRPRPRAGTLFRYRAPGAHHGRGARRRPTSSDTRAAWPSSFARNWAPDPGYAIRHPPRRVNASQPSRIGDGTQPPRRPLIPRWVRLLLHPVFALLLLIPAVRRLRRDTRRWNMIRAFAAAAAAVAAAVCGAAWSTWWLVAPAARCSRWHGSAIRPVARSRSRTGTAAPAPTPITCSTAANCLTSWPAVGWLRSPGSALHLLLRGRELLFVPIESRAKSAPRSTWRRSTKSSSAGEATGPSTSRKRKIRRCARNPSIAKQQR